MKQLLNLSLAFMLLAAVACNSSKQDSGGGNTNTSSVPAGGQENVQDDVSQKDVVKIAVGSKDHTTLVAALKQAGLVSSLSNAGPFTVFAPTNEAFNKLPAGTVDGLMKDDKKADLENILQYHVTTSSLKPEYFTDGMDLSMVNGDKIKVSVKDGKIVLNGTANVTATIPAANGMVYVIDAVLLPPAKK
ncbi:MAG: fasciclin domain-containing protein [Bacteroidetes bacterium]|nr:fasciclin domain-containing protein [Bacteroidota bacterium]